MNASSSDTICALDAAIAVLSAGARDAASPPTASDCVPRVSTIPTGSAVVAMLSSMVLMNALLSGRATKTVAVVPRTGAPETSQARPPADAAVAVPEVAARRTTCGRALAITV